MRPNKIGQSYDAIAQRWQDPQMQSIGISQLDRAVQFTTAREYALDIGCSCSGRFIDRVITHGLQVASGIVIGCQDAAVHGALSAALGQPVVLAQEAEISQLDAGPIHILTSASLVGSEQRFRMQESMSAVFVRTWLSIYPGKVWSNKSGSAGVCVSGERYS